MHFGNYTCSDAMPPFLASNIDNEFATDPMENQEFLSVTNLTSLAWLPQPLLCPDEGACVQARQTSGLDHDGWRCEMVFSPSIVPDGGWTATDNDHSWLNDPLASSSVSPQTLSPHQCSPPFYAQESSSSVRVEEVVPEQEASTSRASWIADLDPSFTFGKTHKTRARHLQYQARVREQRKSLNLVVEDILASLWSSKSTPPLHDLAQRALRTVASPSARTESDGKSASTIYKQKARAKEISQLHFVQYAARTAIEARVSASGSMPPVSQDLAGFWSFLRSFFERHRREWSNLLAAERRLCSNGSTPTEVIGDKWMTGAIMQLLSLVDNDSIAQLPC